MKKKPARKKPVSKLTATDIAAVNWAVRCDLTDRMRTTLSAYNDALKELTNVEELLLRHYSRDLQLPVTDFSVINQVAKSERYKDARADVTKLLNAILAYGVAEQLHTSHGMSAVTANIANFRFEMVNELTRRENKDKPK